MRRWLSFFLLVGVCSGWPKRSPSPLTLATDAHFEVYAQGGAGEATRALTWLNQLRIFFDRNGVLEQKPTSADRPPLRVIAFASKAEYGAYKLRSTADAYYVGSADRDYIVMPMTGPDQTSIAAHEYAHYAMHSRGLKLPQWLGEGLAELFSTIRLTGEQYEVGGELPGRAQTLERHAWIPAPEFFAAGAEAPVRSTQAGAALFYAESWAVTEMLVDSPAYAGRVRELVGGLNSGAPLESLTDRLFDKSPADLLAEARVWRNRSGPMARQKLAAVVDGRTQEKVRALSAFETNCMLGDLLLVSGKWQTAERLYQALLREQPGNADVLAASGTVRLYLGDRPGAMKFWRRAMDGGIPDASLCYRYALLAEEEAFPPAEIKRALEKAVAQRPDFTDARYRLAMLESNEGEYREAVEQLQAMSAPAPPRAFSYWSALAYALTQADRRAEAKDAARRALQLATTEDERGRAQELAVIAATDLTVQFERGPDGKTRLVMTRIPHGTQDWNPFIEAGERIEKRTGALREVQCGAGRLTGFVVQSEGASLTLTVADAERVLVREGPTEFTCGAQEERTVTVEFAAQQDGRCLLRGIWLR